MRHASALVVLCLVTARLAPAQAPAPPVQRLMRFVRVQLKPVTGMDTMRWFAGEQNRTRNGCTYFITTELTAATGHFALVEHPKPLVMGGGVTVSLDMVRAAMTREHERDAWQVVDPAWMDRASVCAGRS